MGIVVALSMLLGLIVLRPTPWRSQSPSSHDGRFILFTVVTLFLVGSWNVFWYGFSHMTEFWGWAALVSGGAMIFAAIIIFSERKTLINNDEHPISSDQNNPNLNSFERGYQQSSPIRRGVILVLAICFLLYAVTIIQLNFGLATLG